MVKVVCELCGAEISKSNYSKHLRRHEEHPESFKEVMYKLNHEGLECQFCGKECKNRNSLCNHERLCKENPDVQDKSYLYMPRPNFNRCGRDAWNKGLTKYTNESIRRQAEEQKRRYQSGELPKPKWPLSSEESREKHKLSMKRVYSISRERPRKKFKAGIYNGIECDSSWELAYLLYCLDNNISIVRNHRGFKYRWDDGEHTYFPDFYLPEEDTYVEIKGYKVDRDDQKINQFPLDLKLKVIKKDDMKPILKEVRRIHGNDFIELYDKKSG